MSLVTAVCRDVTTSSLQDMVPSTSTSSSPPLSVSSTPSRHDTNILRRIPVGAESMAVLVGAVDFLDREVTAFIRLSSGRHLDNVIEVPLPVRFIFILLGPPSAPIHYHEVGRSIATLMANKVCTQTGSRRPDS